MLRCGEEHICCAVLSVNNCVVVAWSVCCGQDVIKFQPLLRTMGAQIARVRNMTAFLAAALQSALIAAAGVMCCTSIRADRYALWFT